MGWCAARATTIPPRGVAHSLRRRGVSSPSVEAALSTATRRHQPGQMTVTLALLLLMIAPAAVADLAPAAVWPVGDATQPPAVVATFDPPTAPWHPGHRGVDLAATPGSRVRAAGDGVVTFAGPLAGRGVISVRHPRGLRTTYEPVLTEVAVGSLVRRGQVIGTLAQAAGQHRTCAGVACLHWGARLGDRYLDPLSLLGSPTIRLLPSPSWAASGARVGLTVGTAQPVDRHVRVALSRGHRSVSQQLLDRSKVRSALQQMSRR